MQTQKEKKTSRELKIDKCENGNKSTFLVENPFHNSEQKNEKANGKVSIQMTIQNSGEARPDTRLLGTKFTSGWAGALTLKSARERQQN